jgi:spore germination protein KB
MKEKVSRLQYFFLIPNLIFGKAIGITAGIIVRKIGADVWSSMTIGFVITSIFVVLMVYASSQFPDKTMIAVCEEIFGKWLAKLIAIIFAVYFAFAYGVSANVMLLHLKEYFLPDTPFIVLSIVYTLVCAYGVILGPEVVIRFSTFGFIMLLGINITMILGTMNDFSLTNLQPIFDQGIKANVMNSIYVFCDTTMVIASVGMVYPMLNNKKRVMPISIAAIIVAFLSVIIWPIFEVGVLGADVMKQFVVVCMQQVRSAQLTRYLPRYELIMVSFFVWSVYVQSTLMFFDSEYSIKEAFKLKKNRWILLALLPIMIIITNQLGKDHNNYISFLAGPWTKASVAIGVVSPIVFSAALLFKKKPRKGNQKKPKEA